MIDRHHNTETHTERAISPPEEVAAALVELTDEEAAMVVGALDGSSKDGAY